MSTNSEDRLAKIINPRREYLSASIPENGVNAAKEKLREARTPAIANGELSVASPARMNRAMTVNQSPMYDTSLAKKSRLKGRFPLSNWRYPIFTIGRGRRSYAIIVAQRREAIRPNGWRRLHGR